MHLRKRFLHNIEWETILYFLVYIIYLIYGLRVMYDVRDNILKISKFEFASGWKFLERPRDDSNDELENFTAFVHKMWPWYLIHTVVNTVVRVLYRNWQNISHAVICIAAFVFSLRFISVGVLGAALLSYYAIAGIESKTATWTLSILWMIVINVIKNSSYWYTMLGYTEYFTLIITLSWCLLRCCSFVLNRIEDKASGVKDIEALYSFKNFLGYTLYFPNMVYGPFLGFHRYAVICKTHQSKYDFSLNSAIDLLWNLVRVALWWLFVQVALHFLYLHYMARDVNALQQVKPTFSQHAIGYFMGQFFFLYYVITYGLGIAFARYDGLNPPKRPRCIGRIHFYSDMWKYFDEGLYEFLFKHIYAELCGKRSSLVRKLFATAATFAFVFVWHGCYMYVLIWSILNFGCLVAEKFFKVFVNSPFYTTLVSRHLSERGAQRLYAVLATQLFIPAAFSNVYFISGQEVGNYLMRGAYMSGIMNYIALTFCSYCFFQCSEFILKLRKSDA